LEDPASHVLLFFVG